MWVDEISTAAGSSIAKHWQQWISNHEAELCSAFSVQRRDAQSAVAPQGWMQGLATLPCEQTRRKEKPQKASKQHINQGSKESPKDSKENQTAGVLQSVHYSWMYIFMMVYPSYHMCYYSSKPRLKDKHPCCLAVLQAFRKQ